MSYVKKHKKEFQVEASRDLVYVKFDINPTKEDEDLIKKEVANLLYDKEEYSSAAKASIKILGFKNTTNDKAFFTENSSDIVYSDDFLKRTRLPKLVADSILNAKEGDVIGPYKERDYYKLTKVKAFRQMPYSVKATQIIISFNGALRSTDTKT